MKQSKRGPISTLYPLSKVVFVVALLAMALLAQDYRFGYFVVVPFTMIIALLDGVFLSYLKKFLAAMVLFVLFVFAFKIMLDTTDSTILLQWGPLVVREAGLQEAFAQSSMIMSFASLLILFFDTTDMEDFMISLNRVGVSHVGSYVTLSTLQMIPEMAKKSKVIMQAQQARGIETEGNLLVRAKAFFPALGPLVISSISDLEDRAITLEVRGFSSDVPKTHYRTLVMGKADYVLIVVTVLALVAFLVGRFVL